MVFTFDLLLSSCLGLTFSCVFACSRVRVFPCSRPIAGDVVAGGVFDGGEGPLGAGAPGVGLAVFPGGVVVFLPTPDCSEPAGGHARSGDLTLPATLRPCVRSRTVLSLIAVMSGRGGLIVQWFPLAISDVTG
jgi:hypothetical protein